MTIDCAFFGTLTRDADLRVSKKGKNFAILNVAVGEGQFASVLVFGASVDAVGALTKGAKIYCEGTIEVSTWKAQDGTTRAGFKVISFKTEETHQIGRNRAKRDGSKQPEQTHSAPIAVRADRDLDDDIPF
jgi:single-stranded DNA-binding protein